MRIGLQTWGTDGDILPFLSLAGTLAERGHVVTIAYTSLDGKDHDALATRMGVRPVRVPAPIHPGADLFALTTSRGSLRQLRVLLERYHDPITDALFQASTALCAENDLVIDHVLCPTLTIAAEQVAIPRVVLALFPQGIRADGISPLGGDLGRWVNGLMWSVGDAVMTRRLFRPAQRLRERLGLRPWKSLLKEQFRSPVLNLVAASRTLLPGAIVAEPDLTVCGAFPMPGHNPAWALTPREQAFLDTGPPPVFLTFGSCTAFDPEGAFTLLTEAARAAGTRAIVQVDPTIALEHLRDPHVLLVHGVPHDELFPKCALVVHHGGAGTTHAVCRAGRPSIVVEHAYDQAWWGMQLHRVGAAPRVLHRRSVNAERLARAIRTVVGDKRYGRAAIQVAEGMRQEEGPVSAVRMIEALDDRVRKG